MGLIKVLRRRIGIARELLAFFAHSKRWWLLPIIVTLLLLSGLLLLAQSSVIAPFIYTLL